jgi:hypothetical protein
MATILQQSQSQDAAQPAEIRIRAAVYQREEGEEKRWGGMCLEYAIFSMAKTREALLADLERMIRFYLRWAEREGTEPFASVQKAPKQAWDMYSSGAAEQLEFVIRAGATFSASTVELRAH